MYVFEGVKFVKLYIFGASSFKYIIYGHGDPKKFVLRALQALNPALTICFSYIGSNQGCESKYIIDYSNFESEPRSISIRIRIFIILIQNFCEQIFSNTRTLQSAAQDGTHLRVNYSVRERGV